MQPISCGARAGQSRLYAQKGYRVRILCLSFGERGESERLWKKEGMTVECVKAGAAEGIGACGWYFRR